MNLNMLRLAVQGLEMQKASLELMKAATEAATRPPAPPAGETGK
jgi:hypothetical protein